MTTPPYPVPPETHFITSYRPQGLIQLAVYAWGAPNAFPLICVHGLTGTGRDFDFIAPELAKAGYRVLAIDMAGRGISDSAHADTYRYSYYLHDLAALLTFAGATTPASCDWLGISMGGLLGMRIAGLSNSPIRKMVLDDIGCEVPQADLDAICQYLRYPHIYDSHDQMLYLMKESNAGPFANGKLDDVHWQHRLDTRTKTLPDNKIGLLWDRGLTEWFEREPIGELDYWPLWHNTHQPVLALRGALSTLFPIEIAHRMAQEKAGAKLDYIEIADCGHVPPLLQPDQIKLVVDWFKQP